MTAKKTRAAAARQAGSAMERATGDLLERLAELAPLAASNRGPIDVTDPRRQAAVEFTGLLAGAREQGIPISAIVEATGSPWRTLKARLRRHQLVGTPPSIKPYQGRQFRRPEVDRCLHGHEFDEVNTFIYLDKQGRRHRVCRRCRADRQATRRATDKTLESAKTVSL